MSTEPSGVPPAPPPDEATTVLGARQGSTWISDTIVAKVAGAAALEVDGVAALRAEGARGWGKGPRETEEATVTVTDGVATIDLRLVVQDGVHIPSVVEAVRARVGRRVEETTGMRVERIDIGVVDVTTAPATRRQGEDTGEGDAE